VDYVVKKGEGLDYELDHPGEGDRGFAFRKLRSVACGFKIKTRGQKTGRTVGAGRDMCEKSLEVGRQRRGRPFGKKSVQIGDEFCLESVNLTAKNIQRHRPIRNCEDGFLS
jgi:hypothetical protein